MDTNMDAADETLTVAEAGRRLRAGTLTAEALVERSLERIHAHDGSLKACVTVMADEARAAARAADERLRDPARARGASPLCGIPLGVKDLYQTRGVRTSAGSRVLEDYIPDEDAAGVARLRRAGAALVAKTNTHEFAYGTFTPPTRNPWDLERIPGGSSGGSAAGIAAGMFPAALGSDTGGSIRIPAACCGVTGLKPTYGLVSRAGIIALSWSYDHAGPLARTVEDCALLLDELAGYDPSDPDSVEAPTMDFAAALMDRREPAEAVRGAKIGVPRQFFFDGAESEVVALVSMALGVYESLGAQIVEVDLPDILNDELFDKAYRAVQRPEATLYHTQMGWLGARDERYTPTTLTNLKLGGQVLATDYIQGQRIRRTLTSELRALLAGLDALAMPTLPIVAPRIAALDVPLRVDGREVTVGYMTLRNTFPFDLTGQPALALPCGFTEAGLPASLQLVAGHFNEPALLRLGHAYQRVTDWHARQSNL